MDWHYTRPRFAFIDQNLVFNVNGGRIIGGIKRLGVLSYVMFVLTFLKIASSITSL